MRSIVLRALFSAFALFCLLSASLAQPASVSDAATPISIGRFSARFVQGGLFLNYDGIPVLKGGITQVFAKDYSRGYYGSGSNPPVGTVELLPDGGRAYLAQFVYQGDGNAFQGLQRIEVHPEGRVIFTIRARWEGQDSAILEWNPIRLWAYPLVGSTYQAETPEGGSVAGRIGLKPLGSSYPASRLAPPWTRLELRLPALGALNFTSPDTTDLPVAFDARTDPYLQNDKLFWLGSLGTEMPPGQEITRTITLMATPSGAPPVPSSVSTRSPHPVRLEAQTLRIPDANRPEPPLLDPAGHPLLIPNPKHVIFTDTAFPLHGRIPVTVNLPAGEAEGYVLEALHALISDLARDTGVKFVVQSGPWRGRGLYVTVRGIGQMETGEALPTPDRAEGYTLRVSPEKVILVGHDAAGAFYGLQTLRQLVLRSSSALPSSRPAPALAGVEIVDWPSLVFRGAHLFVGKSALPFHERLIEGVLSRYKLNTLVIECEHTQWKSHPEIAVPFSMPQEDLRTEVAFARAHFMEPIPLVNSLGHSEWIFKNGQHLDLAEDVSSPHAYDVSNPDTYKFLFDVYQEAIDIFHPRLFHIGHDEVKVPASDLFGKYPARTENIRKGIPALFIEDTNRLADWLRAHGVRTMLWGDMLLHRTEGPTLPHVPEMSAANAPSLEEAIRLRELLPKDAVIADWRYEPGSEQRNGLRIFQASGLEALGSAWFAPGNIRGWAAQAAQTGALGTLQTTWAGYDSNASLLETEYRQFYAFVLAAEYAWNGGQGAGETGEPPYRASEAFARAFRAAPLRLQPRSGWYLSLRHAANINLFGGRSDTLPWSAYPPASREEMADTTDTFLDPGSIPEVAAIGLHVVGPHLGGIMLQGLLNPPTLPLFYGDNIPVAYPSAVSLPLHAKARELAFLQATGYAIETGEKVATYRLVYADGKTVEIPLRYGYEIRALDDPAECGYSTSALPWDNGNALTLRLFRWTNPRPKVPLSHLEFRTENPYAAPILFSLTGSPPPD